MADYCWTCEFNGMCDFEWAPAYDRCYYKKQIKGTKVWSLPVIEIDRLD